MFFFQAEDGIRDIGVTGVQTCALPISNVPTPRGPRVLTTMCAPSTRATVPAVRRVRPKPSRWDSMVTVSPGREGGVEGKRGGLGGRRIIKKKIREHRRPRQ